ncbi:MAG TPA: Gmad2 immunoglobulin-like domain-containing protein [Gaiellaceae bacterium]|nr:Gmad2 immunoglobulin-like domain-containing protein [Gaiellaceae bacterium]
MKYAIVTLAVVLAALLGLVAASCGGGGAESAGSVPTAEPGGDVVGTSTSSGSESVPPPDTTGGSGSTDTTRLMTYEAWFTRGESLFAVSRAQLATPRVGSAAMEALLEGPDPRERAAGVGSQVPPGTQFLGLTVEDGIATVDLTSEFESGGGSASLNMRIAQVVYMLTQFPTVKGVLFQLDGQSVDVLGGEGIVVDQPVTRKDFRDLLPAILVRKPEIGERVSNPVTVSGSANVFEANVSVEIVDANGKVVGSTFTTATCGTGCRGTFSVSVPYDISAATRGLVIVHDDDAADTGTPPHEVRIPVVLTPSS